MATFDQLSDEQRAIVELVLQQGKSYDELSGMLGMPESRVRELARDALVDLAPISAQAVEEDWRGQLADYVLGQQGGPEATATRGHLRRSEAARSWTRSLLDSLEQLYPNGDTPAIPEGERGRERGARRAAGAAAAQPGPLAASTVRRRQIMAAAGAGLVILLAVLLWPIGVLTGGDDDGGSSSAVGSNGQEASDESPIPTNSQGQALIIRQQRQLAIVVRAAGLAPTTGNKRYEAWLYNSDRDRQTLGVTKTDRQGAFQVLQALPADYRKYEFVDLTEATVQGQSSRPGPSVLRGLLELRKKPLTQGSGNKRITVLADIRMRPLPG